MHAVSGKTELFENVNIDWNLISEEHIYELDYSDDDLDAGAQVHNDHFMQSQFSGSQRSKHSTSNILLIQWTDAYK